MIAGNGRWRKRVIPQIFCRKPVISIRILSLLFPRIFRRTHVTGMKWDDPASNSTPPHRVLHRNDSKNAKAKYTRIFSAPLTISYLISFYLYFLLKLVYRILTHALCFIFLVANDHKIYRNCQITHQYVKRFNCALRIYNL